jgi:hypothetical protein
MPKRSTAAPVAPQVDALDVRLLDFFAEIEAMLRYARNVQRYLIKLRGTSAPVSRAQQRMLVHRVRKTVRTIDRESQSLRTVVRSVTQAAADLQSAVRADRRNGQQTASEVRLPNRNTTRNATGGRGTPEPAQPS